MISRDSRALLHRLLRGNSDELTGVRVNSSTLRGFPLSPFVYTHLCNASILLSFLAITLLTSHPSISIKRKPFTRADQSIGRNSLLRARERCGGGRGIHGYLLFPDSALVSRRGVLDPLDRIELKCKGHPEHPAEVPPFVSKGRSQKLGHPAGSKQNLQLCFLTKASRLCSTLNAHEGALLCLLGSEEAQRDRNPIRSIDLSHLLFS